MNNALTKKQGIYIELDALLDTRFAILHQMGGNILIDAFDNGYFTRKTDTFYNVDKTTFDELYKKRDKNTLKDAVVTKSISMIMELVTTMNTQAIESPFHAGPKIILNIYPYVLNEDEISSLIKGLVLSTKQLSDVEVINFSPEQLTPNYCKDNLAIMFIYDYAPWLEAQAQAFQLKRTPEIAVFVPGIYFVKEPSAEELAHAIENHMHPLRAIEFISSVFINLRLYDIDFFSANIPVKEKTMA